MSTIMDKYDRQLRQSGSGSEGPAAYFERRAKLQ